MAFVGTRQILLDRVSEADYPVTACDFQGGYQMARAATMKILYLDLGTREGRVHALREILGPSWRAALAAKLPYDPSLISHVVSGRRTNREVQEAIAKVLGAKRSIVIFPDAA